MGGGGGVPRQSGVWTMGEAAVPARQRLAGALLLLAPHCSAPRHSLGTGLPPVVLVDPGAPLAVEVLQTNNPTNTCSAVAAGPRQHSKHGCLPDVSAGGQVVRPPLLPASQPTSCQPTQGMISASAVPSFMKKAYVLPLPCVLTCRATVTALNRCAPLAASTCGQATAGNSAPHPAAPTSTCTFCSCASRSGKFPALPSGRSTQSTLLHASVAAAVAVLECWGCVRSTDSRPAAAGPRMQTQRMARHINSEEDGSLLKRCVSRRHPLLAFRQHLFQVGDAAHVGARHEPNL